MVYLRAERKNKKEAIRTQGWKGFYMNEHPTGKEVVQMNLIGGKLNVWECLSLASFKTKIDAANISRCCNKKRKTAGGFKWCFLSDFLIDNF